MINLPDNLLSRRDTAVASLLAARNRDGVWEGRLSSSALATAVTIFALSQLDNDSHQIAIARGLHWLEATINDDGGWGDSPESPSNLTTTLLGWAAFAGDHSIASAAEQQAADYCCTHIGSLEPDAIAAAIRQKYGNDATFAAPILAMCALAGRLGDQGWDYVPALPFELVLLPRAVFRFLQLHVVSYAIPALVAIGLLRHRRRGTPDRLRNCLRNACTGYALRVVQHMQPARGGFLEAAPLTGFVIMSLAAVGLADHPIVHAGVRFLREGQREDGSWPIDSDLGLWVTTLSVNALPEKALTRSEKDVLRDWLLVHQMTGIHPFTGASGGGWGWTPRAGAVPDADDTAGALLALRRVMRPCDVAAKAAAIAGIGWLLRLQNSDGGMPTFCRGWGKLPFDQSCPDLTAHALRALDDWYDDLPRRLQVRIDSAMQRAVAYLAATQADDGSWSPLWFGSQWTAARTNPVYGTAQTLRALRGIAPGRLPDLDVMIQRGVRGLLASQHPDGGWGAAAGVTPSIEETALAVSALAGLGLYDQETAALRWLETATDGYRRFPASPIGLYFASLWYAEALYPPIFTVQALTLTARM